MSKVTRSAVAVAALSIAMSACGLGATDAGSPGSPAPHASTMSSTDPAPSVSPSGSPSSSDPSATSAPPVTTSASPSTSPTAHCSGLTGRQAVDKWIHLVPRAIPDFAWNPAGSDFSAYDQCAALSAITIYIEGTMGSSPRQIMLFHNGEFVKTATPQPVSDVFPITRPSGSQVQVTYGYLAPGDTSNAAMTGRAVSVFRWDDSTKRIVRTGDLPPEATAGRSASPSTAATSGSKCAGGYALPKDLDPRICGPTPAGSVRPPTGGYGGSNALLQTPTSMCSVGAANVDCVLINGGPTDRLDLDTTGPGYAPKRDDAPAPGPVFALGDGKSVVLSSFVCLSTKAGIACWNPQTRHGLFLSGNRQLTW